MRIIHIIPGSGGSFYCGNCLRDSKYVKALRESGHEVIKIPMYLPLFSHDRDDAVPVFYGAISIYLKQMIPLFRHAPRWFDSLLNAGPMLKLAAGMAGSTRAKGLEEMTLSMLRGEHGKQNEELGQMIHWIKEHYQPDIVHLSNALLSGLAPRIRRELGARIFCSLQDEDVWVDVMKPAARREAWQLIHDNTASIDGYIGVSRTFSALMKETIGIPDSKLFTVHLGIDPADYEPLPISEKPRNIGFISRLCEENGLGILVEAFIGLKKQPGFETVRLVLTGGSTGDDKQFLKKIRTRIREVGVDDQVDFLDDFGEEGRRTFFRSVSLVSVPVLKGEAFGLYLLESMASGVPVVQPTLGAFPEIVGEACGGVVYSPNEPEALTEALANLLTHPEQMEGLSQAAVQGVKERFNIFTQSTRLFRVYDQVMNTES